MKIDIYVGILYCMLYNTIKYIKQVTYEGNRVGKVKLIK